jgi:hypothetical protein
MPVEILGAIRPQTVPRSPSAILWHRLPLPGLVQACWHPVPSAVFTALAFMSCCTSALRNRFAGGLRLPRRPRTTK